MSNSQIFVFWDWRYGYGEPIRSTFYPFNGIVVRVLRPLL